MTLGVGGPRLRDVQVLLAGCGYVATEVGMRLQQAGRRALALRRDIGKLPEGLPGWSADLTDASSLSALPEPIDAVVYSASPDSGDAASYESAYVRGLETCLGFLADRGDPITRVVLTTSTGIYTQTGGAWVSEDTPIAATTATARSLFDAEQSLARSPFSGVSLRLGGIYGPDRTNLIERVRAGTARLPRTARYTNRIHRDDAAQAILQLLEMQEPAAVYNGVDHDPADLREVLRFLATELNVPESPLADENEPRGPRGQRGHKRVRNGRLLESGFRFQYPSFREGYRALLPRL